VTGLEQLLLAKFAGLSCAVTSGFVYAAIITAWLNPENSAWFVVAGATNRDVDDGESHRAI
jgi:hypothetical protein